MITGKINVSLIDKSKLFEGKKGKYLDIVLIETPDSEYGDYMIVQDVPKEERAAGNKGAILGNAKIFNRRGGNSAPAQQEQSRPTRTATPPPDDDVPF